MNSRLVKQLLPHLIAIVIFLTVSLFFCKPILEGNVLKQSDIIGWKSMAQNAFEYKAKHGHYPLWNPNLFSGMPNYQVIMEGKSVLPDFVKILSLWLPKPINFFFLACICFYILCLSLRLRPLIGILGSIAFAFATYNPIIIGVGHESKMFAIAFMPLAMAGIILTYEKKYWLGLSVTTLGALLEIAVNHIQITYYFALIAAAVSTAYIVTWIKNREWKHMLIAGSIVAGAAVVAIASTAVTLLTTYEYAKATTRGGKDISVEGDVVKKAKTSGLDTSYAFQYSFGRAETVVLMMPKAFAYVGATNEARISQHIIETLESNSGSAVFKDLLAKHRHMLKSTKELQDILGMMSESEVIKTVYSNGRYVYMLPKVYEQYAESGEGGEVQTSESASANENASENAPQTIKDTVLKQAAAESTMRHEEDEK